MDGGGDIVHEVVSWMGGGDIVHEVVSWMGEGILYMKWSHGWGRGYCT